MLKEMTNSIRVQIQITIKYVLTAQSGFIMKWKDTLLVKVIQYYLLTSRNIVMDL